ncbi:putative IS1648 transposase [Streptomyces bingchenggensis BCW-1]|uniref:Putative IS1648 transposase n=1 Tax=Streptomyces bingchenggensis (strain BCW-1) TaxID=749414 RepID=D7C5V7_STRBB|nr:putative IS1648 transposase [Streptomyces bingchenggensis BCW-1]
MARLIGKLKISRAVAMRFDECAYVFHGAVTVAAIGLWLHQR